MHYFTTKNFVDLEVHFQTCHKIHSSILQSAHFSLANTTCIVYKQPSPSKRRERNAAMTRLTQDTDEFVMVIPGKALDIVNGSVQRVTPSTSLRLLTENVVDSRTGISRHGAIYEMHTVEQAGFALPSESTLQTFFSENQIAVVVGCFTPENRQSLLAGLPKALRPVNPDDDAALVASLYVHFQAQKHKYAFLSQLEGDYAFCIFDERSDSCLASRSAHGSHALYQVCLVDQVHWLFASFSLHHSVLH